MKTFLWPLVIFRSLGSSCLVSVIVRVRTGAGFGHTCLSRFRVSACQLMSGGMKLYTAWRELAPRLSTSDWPCSQYPGQRGGNAVADILFGDVSPAGRLPVTFYKADEKLPSFDDYSMKGRTYRYFDGQPLYPFGHGLSYTSFSYSGMKLSSRKISADGSVSVSVRIKNTGKRAGDEVVQLYVHPLDPQRYRARQELRGVARIALQPGEERSLEFTLSPGKDFTHYDPQLKTYAVDPGKYELQLGASSQDIRLQQTLVVEH